MFVIYRQQPQSPRSSHHPLYPICFTRFMIMLLCRSHHACTWMILLVAVSGGSSYIVLACGGCGPYSCSPTWSPRAVDLGWTTPLRYESRILYPPLPLLSFPFTLSPSPIYVASSMKQRHGRGTGSAKRIFSRGGEMGSMMAGRMASATVAMAWMGSKGAHLG